ncbi:MAG: efflux RND transporter periplasmic adaptor subunit [Granulosicoccus sp.]|nr:efflux RND transporter periplasmic adaptor subunit [Granulosicoccus sp.]
MLKTVVAIALLALALGAGLLFFKSEKPTVVSTVETIRGDVSATLKLTGTVINDHTVTITALLDGEITAINAREGSTVKNGDALAELDNRSAVSRLKKSEAELQLRQQNYQSARQSYNRVRKASNQGTSSKQALEDRLSEFQNAGAQLAIAEADLDIIQVIVDNSVIRAPFDGSVTGQWAEVGQWVEAGTQLFTVVATEGKTIEVMIDAGDFGRVAIGQTAELTSDAWPGINWTSSLNWIAPAINSENNSSDNLFAARLDIGEDAPELLLGQQLNVELIYETRENVLILPLHTLQEFQPGKYSVQIIEDDVARNRTVEVGLVSLLDAEILSGLTEGEQVINTAGRWVREGQAVTTDTSR